MNIEETRSKQELLKFRLFCAKQRLVETGISVTLTKGDTLYQAYRSKTYLGSCTSLLGLYEKLGVLVL